MFNIFTTTFFINDCVHYSYYLSSQRNILQQPAHASDMIISLDYSYTSFYRKMSLLANLHITGVTLASHHSFSLYMVARSTSLHLDLEWCSIKPQDVNKICWLPRWDESSQESSIISSPTRLSTRSHHVTPGIVDRIAQPIRGADCEGGDVREGRLGMVHRTIRFLHCCGQHWGIVGERLSVCVRVYQNLSCLLLRCAGCWLTALPRLLHISQLRANRERKQKPTHCCCKPTKPPFYSTSSLSLYKHLFHKVYLLYSSLLGASSLHSLPFTV